MKNVHSNKKMQNKKAKKNNNNKTNNREHLVHQGRPLNYRHITEIIPHEVYIYFVGEEERKKKWIYYG